MAASFSSISSQLFKHLWKRLSCMAVSFSSISGRVYPAWQSAFQASLEESMAVPAWQHGSFSSISGACMAVSFQASLGESILHGSQLFKHLWKSLSCMAVSFSSISGMVYILHGSQLFKHLWKSLSCMAASFSSISGRLYPAW